MKEKILEILEKKCAEEERDVKQWDLISLADYLDKELAPYIAGAISKATENWTDINPKIYNALKAENAELRSKGIQMLNENAELREQIKELKIKDKVKDWQISGYVWENKRQREEVAALEALKAGKQNG